MQVVSGEDDGEFEGDEGEEGRHAARLHQELRPRSQQPARVHRRNVGPVSSSSRSRLIETDSLSSAFSQVDGRLGARLLD